MIHPDAELVYIHDPMCSWCWGFEQSRLDLFNRLDGQLRIRRLLGGLAPDTDAPMPKEMRSYLQATWQKIEQRIPGVTFNFDFWQQCQPRRSTWPACRAVIAARAQGDAFDSIMTQAIEKAYYENARNPSDHAVLVELAGEMGLDVSQFENEILSEETRHQLSKEISETRTLGAEGFPSLVLLPGHGAWSIPVDYINAEPMFDLIQHILNDD